MLARVAEDLYWLGRYLERAENAARIADVEYHASSEGGQLVGDPNATWDALVAATGSRAAFDQERATQSALSPADFLLLSPRNPNSVRSSVGQARARARTLREHLSREVWQEINALHLTLGRRGVDPDELHDLCSVVKRSVASVFGLYDNTALQDEGRDWFRCGTFIERADMTSRILDAKYHVLLPPSAEVGGPLDRFQWMAVLRSASAWEAFLKSGHTEIAGDRVTDLLIVRRDFPRSLAFCVMALRRHVLQACARTPSRWRVPAERAVTLLDIELAALDIEEIVARGLHEFLQSFQSLLVEIDRAIADHIFHALPQSTS